MLVKGATGILIVGVRIQKLPAHTCCEPFRFTASVNEQLLNPNWIQILCPFCSGLKCVKQWACSSMFSLRVNSHNICNGNVQEKCKIFLVNNSSQLGSTGYLWGLSPSVEGSKFVAFWLHGCGDGAQHGIYNRNSSIHTRFEISYKYFQNIIDPLHANPIEWDTDSTLI